ncbi:hypothetical protein [Zhongshania arctica]|uniref:Ribosomal protein L7/L12 C-terminal domain-containing protein n=1 Tax=Zhongshania arctica TaxID=3238302 RepID=A0ABV3TXB6_9GAMM|tara:strand:- start:9045 stop:9671 length:627 start_codon:yes stop_codon:yes gene_type:complete
MTDTRFDLILTGNVAPGVSRDVAINKLATLFKRPAEQVAKLLTGKPSRVRKDLDHTELKRYQEAFSRIGVITEVVPTATEPHADQESPEAAAKQSSPSSTLSLCPNGTPVLSDDERYYPPIAAPDTGGLSVAAAGETLTQNEAIPLPAPDTDHISLAPAGETIMPPSESKIVVAPSSNLSLCGAGTPLLDPKPKTTYRVPNTEHLSLK